MQVALTSGGSEPNANEGGDQPAHPEQPGENGPPKSHSPTLVTWIGAGVGAAGVIAGSISGLMSISLVSKLGNECGSSKSCMGGSPGGNDYASAHSLATVSDVMFVVGGVGAAVAVATLIIGHSEAEPAAKQPDSGAPPGEGDAPSDPSAAPAAPQSRLRVVPWIGLGSAGLAGVF